MALIVEDGTGIINANCYTTLQESLDYHAERGNCLWATITTAQQTAAKIRATDYIEQVYRSSFKGYKSNFTQALSFPRINVVVDEYIYLPSNTIPQELKKAQFELEIRAAQGDLNLDLTQNVIKKKVGVIEVEYDRNSSQKTRYQSVQGFLAPLLIMGGDGVSVKLVRY